MAGGVAKGANLSTSTEALGIAMLSFDFIATPAATESEAPGEAPQQIPGTRQGESDGG